MVSVICEVPLGARHQGHQLRLQVGWKAGKRRSGHFDRLERSPVAGNADAFVGRRNAGAGLRQDVERGLQQLRARMLQAGRRRRSWLPPSRRCRSRSGQAAPHGARRAISGRLRSRCVKCRRPKSSHPSCSGSRRHRRFPARARRSRSPWCRWRAMPPSTRYACRRRSLSERRTRRPANPFLRAQ